MSSSSQPPVVKAAVITRRVQGDSIRQIAKDLEISRQSATNILNEANVDQQVEQYKGRAWELVPKAFDSIETQLDKGNGELGRKYLVDMKVIGEHAPNKSSGNGELLTAITNLMQVNVQVTDSKQVESVIDVQACES